MPDITQAELDEAFEEVRVQWDTKLAASGHSVPMFVAMNEGGFPTRALYVHSEMKDLAAEKGLTVGELTDIKITVTEH